MILVNTDYISKKELEMLGLVKGSTIQSKNVGKDITTSFKTLVGGELTAYNEMMKKLLPTYGIEVIELPRKDGISASMVRKAMREHDDALLKSLLPTTSLEYIKERGIEL